MLSAGIDLGTLADVEKLGTVAAIRDHGIFPAAPLRVKSLKPCTPGRDHADPTLQMPVPSKASGKLARARGTSIISSAS